MSTATRRSLQIEERPKVLIRSNSNGHARRNGDSHVSSNGKNHVGTNGNGRVRTNGNGHVSPNSKGHASSASNGHANGAAAWNGSNRNAASGNLPKTRVFVAAENRLLREALSRMLTKNGNIEIITSEAAEPFQKSAQNTLQSSLQKDDPGQFSEPETPALPGIQDAKILLLTSKGNLGQDLAAIRKIRSASPELFILLIDVTGDETNFLQCIRAGVRGYLPRDASAEDVVEAVNAMHAGRGLPGHALHSAVSLHRARSLLLPFRERAPTPGSYGARATIDSAGRRRAH